MEITTKFNPTQPVFFMLDNKIVNGVIEAAHTKSSVNLDKLVIEVRYSVHYKYERVVDTSLGFAGNQDKYVDRYFNLPEEVLFSSKEDLLKSL